MKERIAMVVSLTLISLVAYIAGLILLFKIAPVLVKRSFDDPLFIAVAAVAVLGGMLAFGAIGVTYYVWNGNLAIRLLDSILLIILLIIAISISRTTFRPRYGIGVGTDQLSRALAGSFFLFLAVAAAFVLVWLFVASS
jgi:hypothetical protein